MNLIVLFASIFIVPSCHCSNKTPPIKVSISSSKQCPSSPLSIARNITEAIDTYFEHLSDACSCANDPTWTRVGYLDMTDSSQSCPNAWAAINTTVRGCGRQISSGGSCDSVYYPIQGKNYSQVCGRINAYQYGNPEAFAPIIYDNIGLDSWYIEGISLTHGQPGSRTHIWSFVNAWYELAEARWTCPCMISNYTTWPHSLPSFMRNNYFCATGSRDMPVSELLTDNPLWDGEGCTGDNTCCQFNQPPWFYRALPTPTTDDLEVRICGDYDTSDENTYISNLDLYIK